MMKIPGLDFCIAPEDESEGTIDLPSFNGTFSIPKSQIFGGCHSIFEFTKGPLIKKTSTWILCKSVKKCKQIPVLIKQYKRSEQTDDDDANEIDLGDLRREIYISSSLKHDNIIKFLEIAVGKTLDNSKTYFIFEECECFLSELMELKIEGLFEKSMIKSISKQLFQALDYMHKQHIMHRDIHPKNIMFQRNGCLKLANFEKALEFSATDLELDGTCVNYMAPELILEAPTHGSPIDIWAAGCLMGELFLRKPIYPGDDSFTVFLKICNVLGLPNDSFWPEYSSLPGVQKINITRSHSFNCVKLMFDRYSPQTTETIELFQQIFIYDPKRRSTAEACLKHPYFEKESPKESSIDKASKMLEKYEQLKKQSQDIPGK